jgi:gliding motility-associated-like protein
LLLQTFDLSEVTCSIHASALGLAPTCSSDVYTNVNATATDIGSNNVPSCGNTLPPERDVWFTFVCPPDILNFRVELTGSGTQTIKNPVLVVYRGDCSVDGLFELDCINTAPGATSLFLDLKGLTAGATYFLRVFDTSPTATPNAGNFNLCVNEIPPIVTIDQGSSSLCTGTIYDSGGPDNDYGPNEDHVFTICPDQPSACIDFSLTYFNLDAGPALNLALPGFDVLTFFDGPDVNAPVIAQINGSNTATGTDGGGGVCFRVQAGSGCLTIAFQSDATVNFEGFEGHWECSDTPCEPISPIETETAVTPANIVSSILAPGTTVNITKTDCPFGAYGTFSFPTDNNDLGLQKGLVLTTGAVDLVAGPNDLPGASQFNFTPGDAQLDYLSVLQGNSDPSFDACIVEMDVFVASDELTFEYVFGSEEYPEYLNVDFGYNDIFAFLASGPGITGDPNLNGAQNIALLPGTSTPVQIFSVNNLTNWEYYRNNGVLNGSTLQYDGFTSDYLGVKKSLTARVDVIPCNTYRLKLAIADRGDTGWDSGVFISEVKGGAPELDVEFASGLDYFIEDCSGNFDQIVIRLSKAKTKAASYTITVGGTATPGVDYVLNIPAVITFQPGDTVLTFPILPIADNEFEGAETITISISNDYGCGSVVFETLTANLNDNAEVVVNGGADTLYVCAGGTAQLEATGAQTYFWEPPLAVSDPNVPNPTITPTQDLWLKVTGTVGTCVDEDSIFVKIINTPDLVVSASDSTICQGDTVQLLAVTNAGSVGLAWEPKTRLDDPNSLMPNAFPILTTVYTATLNVPGCPEISRQITVNVDTLFFPNLPATEVTICQNYSVQLAEVLNTTTQYSWTPADGLNDPNSSGPVATPEQTTSYILTATSANGYCTQTAVVNVNVTPADVDITGDEYLEICLGDTVTLTAQANPPGATITWQPPFYVTPASGPTVQVAPDESITVRAFYVINGCFVQDSVNIRVDSLPDLAIVRNPDKPIYCPGDTVYLLSKTYEPANFPGITHEWDDFPGELTPRENWNMVINATTTHTFQRVTTNHACVDTAEVLVPVGIPPTFTITADPPEICPGESSKINVTVEPNQKIEWEDQTMTLSCMDCFSPIATPSATSTYMVSTPEADCPGGASITVTVLPRPAISLSDQTICLGDVVTLNNVATNPQDAYTWTANPPGSIADPTLPTQTVSPAVTTTYSVTAIGACTNQGSATITVNSGTIEAGADQTSCPGTPVTLTATVTGATGNVVWTPSNQIGTTVTVQPLVTTTYTARLFFAPNCQASDMITVNVLPGISLGPIQVSPVQTEICEGTPLRLKVEANPPNVSFVWLENGTPIPGSTLDSVIVTPPGDENPVIVQYAVVATDINGCTSVSGPIDQLVKRCFVFPNAFTPGGDGDNDTFSGIKNFGGELEVVDFRVFSRWGQKVFEATANQKSWDGRVDGKDAPMDVYVYYITIRFGNGDEKTFKGDVSLLR